MKELMIVVLTAFAINLQAQDATDDKVASLEVKTSAVCGMCVQTIEEEMIYEKGVKSVFVTLEDNLIHLQYDPRKTDPDKLKAAISDLGYYADDLPGDPDAFAKLPACCQKEGCGKKKE